jgi:hypothetical protein
MIMRRWHAIAVRVDHAVESESRRCSTHDVQARTAGYPRQQHRWRSDFTKGPPGKATEERRRHPASVGGVSHHHGWARRPARSARRGLIVEVTENDVLGAGGNPLTQTVNCEGCAWRRSRHGLSCGPPGSPVESMLERYGVTEAGAKAARRTS